MWPVHCVNCNEVIGYTPDTCPIPGIFCVPCKTERDEEGDEE
jgi:hypothetical protein